MEPFFAESNRLNSVFGDDAPRVNRELELTIPLNPQVSFGDIDDLLGDGDVDGAALWLDRDCVITNVWRCSDHRHPRYEISFRLEFYQSWKIKTIYLFQVPGTTERATPLPALDYLIDRITSCDRLNVFGISPYQGDLTGTLDVSPACFSNILRTSRLLAHSVTMAYFSLTAEQTALLFTHTTGPISIELEQCHFHGPTLLQLAAREQTDVVEGGGRSNLIVMLADEGLDSTPLAELTALLSIPHLQYFSPFFGGEISYESVRKLVSALAANKISRLSSLDLGGEDSKLEIEWEREEESSAWIDLWKAIEQHPSLDCIHLWRQPQPGLCQHSWWQPIVAAVKVNPRLEYVFKWRADRELTEHVEPLLEINREKNRYRPKIAALCRTDPSKAALLLGQAIVAVARKKNMKFRREILCMLLDQLVLTGHNFGVGRVLGKKRPLADTAVVVPNDVLATTNTEPRVVDGITASTCDKNNESQF